VVLKLLNEGEGVNMIFETHAHYEDEKFDPDRVELLSSMEKNRIGRIINVGSSMSTSIKSVELAHQYDFIYAAVGLHPDAVMEYGEENVNQLRELCKDPKVVAIGEIGPDYHYEKDEEVRKFMPMLEDLSDHVLTIYGYSASKTLTAYGMRCGAIVCVAHDEETAEEFKRATEYTARSTWSNCNRSAQVVMGKIYSDPELLAKVDEERRGYREMLLERGRVFEKTLNDHGVKCVPFSAGFFVTVACDNPAEVGAKLEEQDIFCLALPKGIRVSIASISKEKCVKCAEAIAALLK
jgi:aspartate/tyrosine/aromatic aminotransferase